MNLEFCLAADLVNRSLVCQLSHELIRLNVNILLARGRLWCLDIASEEFFSCLGTLLLETLRVILAFVGLEELVGVRSSRDDHRGISATAEHSLIKGNVLREVGVFIDTAVRVLILLLLRNNTRMGSKALSSSTA